MRHRFPGSSALRASTPGLKSDDPSGASPLRDRHAVAAGLGSVDRIAQRQELSLLLLISSNAAPLPFCSGQPVEATLPRWCADAFARVAARW